MSEPNTRPSWLDRVRRWLWLDRAQRTDDREANRGFYPGGHPVYTNRKPASLRFLLVMTAIGIAIALVLINVREAEASIGLDPAWSGLGATAVVDAGPS